MAEVARMVLTPPPTIESFYKLCAEKKLMGLTCNRCKRLTVPPRSTCAHCGNSDLAWTKLPNRGRLVTYTVIHFPPPQFQTYAPYPVGIVELAQGARLPGMIRIDRFDRLRIGMELQADFETTIPKEWPQWPRYFFRE